MTGFVLGSLATVCGMIVGPGTYTFKVKEPWQALGYSVEKNTVKEELALGDGQTSKDVRRGRRESQKRRERKGTYESERERVDDDLDELPCKTQYATGFQRTKELQHGHRER